MEMVYSASNNSFFAKSDIAKYERAGWVLTDLVQVTYDCYLEFIKDRTTEGKARVAGNDGHPVWTDIPPITHEQEVFKADSIRQSLLSMASTVTSDWKTELALGIISDKDKESLIEWMKYIRLLKSIDTSNSPEIEWPNTPSS